MKIKQMLRVFFLNTYQSQLIYVNSRYKECSYVASYHSVLFQFL